MFSLVNVSEKECSSRPVPELTPGDLRGLSDMSRRRWCPDKRVHWWFSGFKILISNPPSLQAVVAASTQGEDRKEAPSDDLTPGACLLMLALSIVECGGPTEAYRGRLWWQTESTRSHSLNHLQTIQKYNGPHFVAMVLFSNKLKNNHPCSS